MYKIKDHRMTTKNKLKFNPKTFLNKSFKHFDADTDLCDESTRGIYE